MSMKNSVRMFKGEIWCSSHKYNVEFIRDKPHLLFASGLIHSSSGFL